MSAPISLPFGSPASVRLMYFRQTLRATASYLSVVFRIKYGAGYDLEAIEPVKPFVNGKIPFQQK